jgi:hypothetical protein
VNVYLWVFPLQLKVAPQAEVPRVAAETSSLEVAKETTVERVVFDLAMEKNTRNPKANWVI